MKYFKIIDSTKFDTKAKKYFVGDITALEGCRISFVLAKDIFRYINDGSWILEVEPLEGFEENPDGVLYYATKIRVVKMWRLDKVPAYQMLSKEGADFTICDNLVLKTALFHWPGVFNFLAKHWDRLSAGKRV